VLVGDDDGVLSALSATTGAERWTYRARGPLHSQPVVHGGMVYVTSNEGRVYGLDVRTGKWVWQYEREISEGFAIRGSSGVLPVGNRVYVGFPDGYLACLSGETGEVVWTRQLSGDATRFTDVDSTPVLVGDTLYISCYSGGVYALDVKDGSTRWRFELETAGPLVVDPTGERIFVVSASQGLYCLDNKGRKLWRQSFAQKGELSQPTVWGPYLLLSAAVDGLYILDQRSGELLQFFDPGQGATARPMAQGDRVYVLSNGGAFFALSRG
jgi:outer membrane protein assembly factor BamB